MSRRPFLSRSDRRALLVLEWLLLVAVFGAGIYGWTRSSRRSPAAAADSTLYNNRAQTTEKPAYVYHVDEEPVETFPFDPNTADSTTLLRLGLAPWQVRAIYRYRAKHGRYHSPEDFQRLPGMTGELWERLGPQVRIAECFRLLEPKPRSLQPRAPQRLPDKPLPSDSMARPDSVASRPIVSADTVARIEKLQPGTLVDINTADTNELKRIPGVASYRARKIVEYRQQLGGYVAVEQVMEAAKMPDELLAWVSVSAQPTRKLDVNHLSVQRLMRHPYVSFYQARDIVEYRRKHGPLTSLDELSLLDTFPPEAIERLRPYVEFK